MLYKKIKNILFLIFLPIFFIGSSVFGLTSCSSTNHTYIIYADRSTTLGENNREVRLVNKCDGKEAVTDWIIPTNLSQLCQITPNLSDGNRVKNQSAIYVSLRNDTVLTQTKYTIQTSQQASIDIYVDPLQTMVASLTSNTPYLSNAGDQCIFTASFLHQPALFDQNKIHFTLTDDSGLLRQVTPQQDHHTFTVELSAAPTSISTASVTVDYDNNPTISATKTITLAPPTQEWISITTDKQYISASGETNKATITAILYNGPGNTCPDLTIQTPVPSWLNFTTTSDASQNKTTGAIYANKLPAQTTTITIKATHGLTEQDIEITFAAQAQPWISLTPTSDFLDGTNSPITITATFGNFTTTPNLQFTQDVDGYTTITTTDNTGILTLTNQPQQSVAINITATDVNTNVYASIAITIVGETPPSRWLSVSADKYSLDTVNEKATITGEIHGYSGFDTITWNASGIDTSVATFTTNGNGAELTLTALPQQNTTINITASFDQTQSVTIAIILIAPPPTSPYLAWSMGNYSSYLSVVNDTVSLSATVYNMSSPSCPTISNNDTTYTSTTTTAQGNDTSVATITLLRLPPQLQTITITATLNTMSISLELTLVPAPPPQNEWISIQTQAGIITAPGTVTGSAILHNSTDTTGLNITTTPSLPSSGADITFNTTTAGNVVSFVLTVTKLPPTITPIVINAAKDGLDTASATITVAPSQSSDTPVFGDYNAAMRVGDEQTLTASVPSGDAVTISVTGQGQGTNWTFDNNTHKLSYILSSTTDIELSVVATYGQNSTRIKITLIFDGALPLTNSFFVFNSSNPQEIMSYNPSFISACSSSSGLDTYLATNGSSKYVNCLNLQGHLVASQYQALSSHTTANAPLKNFYQRLKVLNLNGVHFDRFTRTQTNDSFFGCYTFSQQPSDTTNKFDDFKNLQYLSIDSMNIFNDTIPTYQNGVYSVHTAYHLFDNMSFDSLLGLTINNCNFAVQPQFISIDCHNASINTAEDTFTNCNFPVLNNLKITNNVFAASNMDYPASDTYGREVYVSTFDNTFSNCVFSTLPSSGFDLTNNTFVTDHMTGGSVSTASFSFANSVFTSLDSINLDNLNFTIANTTKDSNPFNSVVSTANYMFGNCQFPELTSLHMNATFARKDSCNNYLNCEWAAETFIDCYVPKLADIYVPDITKQPDAECEWVDTFQGCYAHDDDDWVQVTCHGYSSEPQWWNDYWFSWNYEPDWSAT